MVASVMTLGREHVADVVSVLAEAFHDYSVMRYVLGASDDYAERLDRLVTFFVKARVLRGETFLGIARADGLGAAALVSRPDAVSPPELDALRERTWAELGDDARDRYENFGRATARTAVTEPHIHLRTSPCTSTSATRSWEAARWARPSRRGPCIGLTALRRPRTQRTTSSNTS